MIIWAELVAALFYVAGLVCFVASPLFLFASIPIGAGCIFCGCVLQLLKEIAWTQRKILEKLYAAHQK